MFRAGKRREKPRSEGNSDVESSAKTDQLPTRLCGENNRVIKRSKSRKCRNVIVLAPQQVRLHSLEES